MKQRVRDNETNFSNVLLKNVFFQYNSGQWCSPWVLIHQLLLQQSTCSRSKHIWAVDQIEVKNYQWCLHTTTIVVKTNTRFCCWFPKFKILVFLGLMGRRALPWTWPDAQSWATPWKIILYICETIYEWQQQMRLEMLKRNLKNSASVGPIVPATSSIDWLYKFVVQLRTAH